ncbi:MAG: class I SAM-dependent methyltransferase [Rubrobacteraceae bacterium]
MPQSSYEDPLSAGEGEEFEEDLISFCDQQLDLLGDIGGLDVLYAGGSSVLWIEGLSQRIGPHGSLVVLDLDSEALEATRERLPGAGLASPVDLVAGDVFTPPLESSTLDLAYSAGLFHELDVAEKPAGEALSSLARVVRGGGRIATTDFVNSIPAAQIEDENLQGALMAELRGARPYGIGPPERLVALHESLLEAVCWRVLPPHPIRHFEKIALAEKEPAGLSLLPAGVRNRFRGRHEALRHRIRHQGYSRPATLYVEGRVAGD